MLLLPWESLYPLLFCETLKQPARGVFWGWYIGVDLAFSGEGLVGTISVWEKGVGQCVCLCIRVMVISAKSLGETIILFS